MQKEEAAVRNIPSCNNMPKAVKRTSIKKEQTFSYLVYNITSLGKIARKAEPFSWRSVEDELAVKYLENVDV